MLQTMSKPRCAHHLQKYTGVRRQLDGSRPTSTPRLRRAIAQYLEQTCGWHHGGSQSETRWVGAARTSAKMGPYGIANGGRDARGGGEAKVARDRSDALHSSRSERLDAGHEERIVTVAIDPGFGVEHVAGDPHSLTRVVRRQWGVVDARATMREVTEDVV